MNFDQLPAEWSSAILTHLNLSDLVSLQRVSNRFRHLVDREPNYCIYRNLFLFAPLSYEQCESHPDNEICLLSHYPNHDARIVRACAMRDLRLLRYFFERGPCVRLEVACELSRVNDIASLDVLFPEPRDPVSVDAMLWGACIAGNEAAISQYAGPEPHLSAGCLETLATNGHLDILKKFAPREYLDPSIYLHDPYHAQNRVDLLNRAIESRQADVARWLFEALAMSRDDVGDCNFDWDSCDHDLAKNRLKEQAVICLLIEKDAYDFDLLVEMALEHDMEDALDALERRRRVDWDEVLGEQDPGATESIIMCLKRGATYSDRILLASIRNNGDREYLLLRYLVEARYVTWDKVLLKACEFAESHAIMFALNKGVRAETVDEALNRLSRSADTNFDEVVRELEARRSQPSKRQRVQ